MSDSSTALAAFVAACRSLHRSAEAIAATAANHLHLGPDDITWAHAEHASRMARQAEALVAEVQSIAGAR